MYEHVVSERDHKSGECEDFNAIVEDLKKWNEIGFKEECLMLRTLNPTCLRRLTSDSRKSNMLEHLLEAQTSIACEGLSFYYDMLSCRECWIPLE